MKTASIALLMIGASASLACAGPRMVAPGDVAQDSRVLEVQNRSAATGSFVNEDFALGDWKVEKVNRKWGSTSSAGIGGYSKEKTKTGYSYRLAASQTWEGACSAVKSEQGVGNFSWGKSNLVCECKAGEQTVSASLAGQSAEKHTEGTLKWGERSLEIKVVEETDKSNLSSTPAGYRADEAGKPAGAVEMLRPGRVWLSNSLGESDAEAVTCVFAGLMLYVPPSDH